MHDDSAQLVLVGDGSQRKTIESLAHKLKVEDRVWFVDPRTDIAPYYCVTDVFLSLSIRGLWKCIVRGESFWALLRRFWFNSARGQSIMHG